MRGEIDIVQDRESFRQQNRLTPEPLPSRQPHTTLVNLVRVITALDLLHLMNVFNAIEDSANTMSCIYIFVGVVLSFRSLRRLLLHGAESPLAATNVAPTRLMKRAAGHLPDLLHLLAECCQSIAFTLQVTRLF
jgi:hypothetical protein